ncbi:MAG: hypothetical protein KJ922_04945, partial [Nanoarchaeota archaeon]|nr:hypothetical protein [Nanoarchaeota archaeon]
MTQIEYDGGAGSHTGMNYDLRDARNRDHVLCEMRRWRDIRNLTVGGVSCTVDEFIDYLTSPKSNFY